MTCIHTLGYVSFVLSINKTVSRMQTALIASCEGEVGALSVRKTKSLLALLAIEGEIIARNMTQVLLNCVHLTLFLIARGGILPYSHWLYLLHRLVMVHQHIVRMNDSTSIQLH